MEEWFVLTITGECRNRFWNGPFPDKETARSFAYGEYEGGKIDIPFGDPWYIRSKVTNAEISFIRRVWFGIGKFKEPGLGLYDFTGEKFEVFARDIEGNYQITDDETERERIEEDEETGDYCAGPFVDDWCEPCEGVTDEAATFYAYPYGEDDLFPLGPEGIEFIPFNSGSAPYLNQTLVASTQEEVDAIIAAFSSDYDNVWSSDGSNTLFAAFGWGRVARITHEEGGFGVQNGYPNTNFGRIWYCPEGSVESWLASQCYANFQVYEHSTYPAWNPLAESFDNPAIYLLGYAVKVELFAQVVSNGAQFGTCYTARSRYDLDYYNQIEGYPGYQTYVMRNSIYTDFIPAGSGVYIGGNWWEQPNIYALLDVGFRHTNDLDNKVIGDMVGPWAIAVNFQVTPLFKAANGYDTCDIDLTGETAALTIVARCPRESFQKPFPYSGIGTSDNPNFPPWPFTYGLFREEDGEPLPPEEKTTPEFWGWSGNGIDFPTLLILNPAWAVNAFIDNWPPFKRVPGYKKMIEFIRYITGKKSQYQSIGTDPVTGWEVYPVPVIVGADGSGFPVYGDPVYRQVTAGGKYQ